MAFTLSSLVVKIGAEDGPLNRSLASIKGKLAGLAGAKFTLGGAGGLASTLGLTGLGLGLGGAVKSAMGLEDKFAALSKASDLEGEALAKVKAELLGLSTSLKGVPLDDLLEIAISGAKLGIAAGDIGTYAAAIAKVSTAMDDVPAAAVADGLGKMTSIFKTGIQGTLQFGSAIDKLADSTNATSGDILDVAQRIAGAALPAKISGQEILGFAATLLDAGGKAEATAGALERFFTQLNDKDAAQGFAKTIGVTVAEFNQLKESDPGQVLARFASGLAKLDAGSQNLALDSIGIDGARGGVALQLLAIKAGDLGKNIGLANHEFATLDQINKSYNTTAALASSQWTTAQNKIQILAGSIGADLMPAVLGGIGLLSDFAEGAQEAFTRAKATVGSFAEGIGVDLGAAFEGAGIVLRNLPDMVEYAMTRVGGYFLNAWELLAYGAEVAYNLGHVLWMPFDEAFEVIKTMAFNLKDNLVTIFEEIWNYVSSGFTDPIDIKLKPILEGLDPKLAAQFKLPELRLSGVENQLAEIAGRAEAREAGRVAGKAGSAFVGPPTPQQMAAGGAGAGTGKFGGAKPDGGVTSIEGFARELQDAALKGGAAEYDKKILEQAERQTRLQEQLLAAQKNQRAAAAAVF